LAAEFALTAVERDERGGTPKAERDALRHSGLLALSIPTRFGGLGANWSETLTIVREFAKVDSSIAHVFGFHHLMLATVRLFSRPEQWQPWFEQTARKNWFWGNALNPLDTRTVVKTSTAGASFPARKLLLRRQRFGDADRFGRGRKCRRQAADRRHPQRSQRHHLAQRLEQHRPAPDRQRQRHVRTGAGRRIELLLDPGPLSTPFACLRPLIAQLTFTHMFLGIAEGAFEEARQYTLTETGHGTNPAPGSQPDPYVLGHYGEFWVALEGVRLLVERARRLLDEAWAKGPNLSAEERGHLATAIATAKVAATRKGLELCSRLFEVTGARSTHASLRLDRHWRNLRTQTLHDPVDYKLHELGDWALNQALPIPTFYS
jgi:alkylation response protein AidB-like acyl-CoA dehydrogenase